MKHHEFASLFPMLPDAELQTLAEDIRENGLQTPIVTLDGAILDGRNRNRACEIAGVDPIYEEYSGPDPLAFVISHNLHRRHLSESQRGMVADKLATMRLGDNQHAEGWSIDQPNKPKDLEAAASDLNVGISTVTRARKIRKLGAPELVAAVESGDITVGAAYKVAELPHEEQAALVEQGPEAVKAKAKEIRETPAAPKAPEKPQRVSAYKPDLAGDCWTHAKMQLDRIHANDASRERVLREVISYCEARISEHR